MTYKELKNRIKEEQKSLAQAIRNGKSGRKPVNRCNDNTGDWNTLESNQHTFRHQHIVYCDMFNGTPYNAIEQPRDNNKPSKYYLEQLKNKWEEELDEALRNCA